MILKKGTINKLITPLEIWSLKNMIKRYTRKEMGELWSLQNEFQTMRNRKRNES